MNILLIGKDGQVGRELATGLQAAGKLTAVGRDQADLSEPESLRQLVRGVRPDVIVNAAAYTAVDKAEDEEQLAYTINCEAPGVLAEEAGDSGALLIHYSTDYVYDGTKAGAYLESDVTAPINVYGHSKLCGEERIRNSGCMHLIFRTSWVYSHRGNNFFLTMLKLARSRAEISVVDDQTGAPTSARMVSDVTVCCLQRYKEAGNDWLKSGVYHLVSSGETTWYGFAQRIFEILRSKKLFPVVTTTIAPVSSEEYRTAARRPMNSRLNTRRLTEDFGCVIPDWQACLDEVFESLEQS